jgi:hypothetical protein
VLAVTARTEYKVVAEPRGRQANGMHKPMTDQIAKVGCLRLFVRRIVSEKGNALSRARANTNRDEAWSWASTWKQRVRMRRQQMEIAPAREMASCRMCPWTERQLDSRHTKAAEGHIPLEMCVDLTTIRRPG